MAQPHLSLQWHITTRCNNHCRHCYMYSEATFEQERAGTLDRAGLTAVLGSLDEYEVKWGAAVDHVVLSGGDPLQSPDWQYLVRELRARDKRVSLLGNPESLDESALEFLAEAGIMFFQMSLDGLEETHDYFRSPGSFNRTLAALDRLAGHGIDSNIMFTLFPSNRDQLLPLMRLVSQETPASSFSFDLGCQVGAATGLTDRFTPEEVRAVLTAYTEEKERLLAAGQSIRLAEKPNLLKLVRFGRERFFPLASPESAVVSGCYIGWTTISLLSDGTVLPCRRLPLPVGKMPEQSFEEIFLGSELLKKFRRREFFSGCGRCDFYQVCRGCPAYVHGLTGDPFAPNPICFRPELRATGEVEDNRPADPPLATDFEAEFQWIASMFPWRIRDKLRSYLDDAAFGRAFAALKTDQAARTRFLTDPPAENAAAGYGLDRDQLIFLIRHLSETPWRSKAGDGPADSPWDKFSRIILSRAGK